MSVYKTEISYFVSLQDKNSYIFLFENKRSLFSRNKRNLKNYSKKCPALKSGFWRKVGCDPPANSHMFQTPTIQNQKFLHYRGMAKNFRRVLNCVALLCCEIEKMRKRPSDGNRAYIENIYIPGRKNKSCGMGLGVFWGRRGIKND